MLLGKCDGDTYQLRQESGILIRAEEEAGIPRISVVLVKYQGKGSKGRNYVSDFPTQC